MPKGLTLWDEATGDKLLVQNMDGTMTKPGISVVDEPEEECGVAAGYERVCYAIEPREDTAIPPGQKQLKIFNTVNQLSVFKAGTMQVKT